MKLLIIFLTIPLLSIGQTAPAKDGKIVYHGTEKIIGTPSLEVFNRIQQALPELMNHYQLDRQSPNTIKAKGEIKLNTPYNLIRTVTYFIELNSTQDGYHYLIDSISFTEQNRGEKAVTKSSQDLLENMGEAGKIVGDSEKIINETDLRLQQLLDLLKKRVLKE